MRPAFALDRRSLLQFCGGAVIALGLPAVLRPAFGAELPSTVKPLVLVDRRYWQSVFFAQGLEGPGVEVLPLGRDLARLWQHQIVPRLQSQPLVMVGVTLPADLFGLERLAEGSGASTVAKFAVTLDHAPRRGSPKHFARWMLRWDAGDEAEIG